MTKPLVLTKPLVKSGVNDAGFLACDVDSVTAKIKKDFGDRLRLLREAMGMTMSDLSVECGASRSHLSTAARTGNCQMILLHQLRERTHVDLTWLIAGVGELDRAKLRHLTEAQRKALLEELQKKRAAEIARKTKNKPRSPPSGKVRTPATKEEVAETKRSRRG
jgi:transcriptional regulator with XRE-family HTH domain